MYRNVVRPPVYSQQQSNIIDTRVSQNTIKNERTKTNSLDRDQSRSGSLTKDSLNQSLTNIRFRNNIDFTEKLSDHGAYRSPDQLTKQKGNDDIRCFISMTTTPSRFFEDEFIEVLKSLTYQTTKADMIFVSFCQKYKTDFSEVVTSTEREKRIRYITKEFPTVVVLEPTDCGPATKLTGLLEINEKKQFLNDNDLIIVVDDDMLYSNYLVASHLLCYQIYNCDAIAVNEDTLIRTWHPYTFNMSDTFYLDNYKGFFYGWLSFSFSFSAIKDFKNMYDEVNGIFPDVYYHDDLLVSLYAKRKNLYVVENRFITLHHDLRTSSDLYSIPPHMLNKKNPLYTDLVNIDARTRLDSISPLRDRKLPSGKTREKLEDTVYAHYNISLTGNAFSTSTPKYNVRKQLPVRYIQLVDNIELYASPEDVHVSFVYIDEKNMLITFTVFNEKLADADREILFKHKGTEYSIVFRPERSRSTVITKFSHVITINGDTLQPKQDINTNNYSIMQTDRAVDVSRNKFYSISTVLVMCPAYPYVFYDNADLYKFIEQNYSDTVVAAINNLVPGAYISDVFRYCYLYLNGGIYLDCKKILYTPISDYIDRFNKSIASTSYKGVKDIFIKDVLENYSYNAIMVCEKMSKTIKMALIYSVFNTVKNLYGRDPLSLTGPGCLGDSIDYTYSHRYPYFFYNIIPIKDKDWLSYVVDKNMKKVIKNTYYGYYTENNYRDTTHYHKLWHEKKIYKEDLSQKFKSIKKMSDIALFKTT